MFRGEAHSGLAAIIPRVRPVLLLKKQADQVRDLNVRLSYAGRPDLHGIVGMTYSAPARMPAGGDGLEAGVETEGHEEFCFGYPVG
jgi:hypothetical protein